MARSTWSSDDLRIRLSALRHYCKMTPTEIAGSVGRTVIYLNQMMNGRTTISKKTEESVRRCLSRQARVIANDKPEHEAQAPLLLSISTYLKELSRD